MANIQAMVIPMQFLKTSTMQDRITAITDPGFQICFGQASKSANLQDKVQESELKGKLSRWDRQSAHLRLIHLFKDRRICWIYVGYVESHMFQEVQDGNLMTCDIW